MQDFANGLREVSVHSIHHHFIEARLRMKLMSNDFSQWLHEDAGLTDAARALNRIDIYTATLEDVRQANGPRCGARIGLTGHPDAEYNDAECNRYEAANRNQREISGALSSTSRNEPVVTAQPVPLHPERRKTPQTSPRSWETPPAPVPAPHLDDYQAIVGAAQLDELRFLAREVKGKTVKMVNSTAVGGGVAEMLNRLVPLLGELEVADSLGRDYGRE